jgi:hypothetical protein
LPNLTADKKSGKAALNTFAELAAFFKKEEPKPEPKPDTPLAETKKETEINPGPQEVPPPPAAHGQDQKTEETKSAGEQPPA